MSIYIFAGPTLSVADGRAEIDATFLPPAAQGDVLALCRSQPLAIGIIDGFFDRVPSVWHKEILWAMSQGIHVFGAASMGALRAAELHAFGMIGVGRIFEAYRSGGLEDDDEVAVAHGPSETGYAPTSEPMVNIRYTLESAASLAVIAPDTHCRLVHIAKQLFYTERQYPTILDVGVAQALSRDELQALRAWLPAGRVDQKRADAVELLRRLRAWRDTGPPPKRVAFSFQRTEAWAQLLRAIEGNPREHAAGRSAVDGDAILTEMRLRGAAYHTERQRGLVRALCLALARAQGLQAADQMVREAAAAFCLDQRLRAPTDMDAWLEAQDMAPQDFDRLLREEARVLRVHTLAELDLERDLLDHLRIAGHYGPLARRARDKQRVLAAHGMDAPSFDDVGLEERDLWRWYFEEVLVVPVPDNISDYARTLDFEDESALRRAVLRELCYLRLCADAPAPGRSAS